MKEISYRFERMRLMGGFEGRECKIYPRLIQTDGGMFITYGMLLLSGSDVFNDSYFIKSTDGGVSFGSPEKLDKLETITDGVRTIFSSATEYYSKYHKKWFSFGVLLSYEDDNHPVMAGGISICQPCFIVRDTTSGHYVGDVLPLPLPFECWSAYPHAQVMEYEDGDILLSFYLVPKGKIKAEVLTVRYRYENGSFSLMEAGEPLQYPTAARGLDEPSIAGLDGRYYMTLRTDEQGLVAASDDGFRFSEPVPWSWDDGSILENYNTMQRWIRHKDGLYLVYTRRGAGNDHVFRHRAPIFAARFDEKNMCLIRETETSLIPELGARLGNFTVAELSENEFWVLTAEWMQPLGCEKYGSDNSIWIAKLKFE